MPPSKSLPNLASLSLHSPKPNFFEPWIRSNGFTHDPSNPSIVEFGRLAEHMGWQRGSKGYLKRHREFLEWNKDNNLLPSPLGVSESNRGSDHSLAAGLGRHRPDFFDNFRSSGFVPDPSASLTAEFKRLAKHQGWGGKSKQFYDQRAICFATAFETHYGNKSERLDGWQRLCGEVHIDPIPESITQCKKALRGIWVNIVDLIDCRRIGRPVTLHPSRNALKKYSKKHKKIFSLQAAKDNGFLTALLIDMF